MEIYLMQHGKAFSEVEDPKRSLTPEGKEEISFSGRGIARLEIKFDLILCSTKQRALQTAEIVAKETGYPLEKIESSPRFDPLASVEEAISYLASLKDRNRILVVGHLPSLEKIASQLLSETPVSIQFQMGSLCRIDIEGFPAGKAKLIWFLMPQHLRLIAE